MKDSPLSVAVVGHTNAGKTSLMRTLLRDANFGEVADAAGTTRHVEGAALQVDGSEILRLYDTPGLEDSISLLEAVELAAGEELEGPERLLAFLEKQTRFPGFDQEAKVVRQLLGNDLIFYVVDVREPVLAKYRDELALITLAARPVIPVLNFVSSPRSLSAQWQARLARMNLHATVEFDTVVFSLADEKRLLQKMQSLMADAWEPLQRLLDHRLRVWQQTRETAARQIARTFVRAASLRLVVPLSIDKDEEALATQVDLLQSRARTLEEACLQALLRAYGFRRDDVRLDHLPVRQDHWQRDLFDRTQLRRFGAEAGGNAARGAAVGAGVDLVVGGLSLGAASALGALAGALVSASRRFGTELKARWNNQRMLCLDEATLRHFWNRQIRLMNTLEQRGHAAPEQAVIDSEEGGWPSDARTWVRQARSNPDWYADDSRDAAAEDPDRETLILQITQAILDQDLAEPSMVKGLSSEPG